MRRSATSSPTWAFSFLVALAPLVAAADPADGELQSIRDAFSSRPIAASRAELSALALRRPDSEAARRARLWLGDLALQAKRYDEADARYEDARESSTGEDHALALRGLGAVAAQRHRWSEAASLFDQALAGAPPLLAYELRERSTGARREHRRFLFAVAAAALYAGVALAFALRLRRRPRDLFPTPLRFMLPLYALFIAAAWGRDPAVLRALGVLAAGSLGLSWLAFATRGRRPLVEILLVVAATVALGYFALWHAAILDVLRETIQSGGAAG